MTMPMPERLNELLSQPLVTDLCFNQYSLAYFDQGQGMELVPGPPIFSTEAEYRTFVLEHISLSGKTWDAKLPFVDTVFFQTHRAHIAFPPLASSGIYVSLRRLPTKDLRSKLTAQLESQARWQSSESAFSLLKESTLNHETIVFAGGTGSGKTTLLNDLLSFVPENERIIALEDTAEVHPSHPHFLGLLSRVANADGFGLVSLKDLLRQTLRMRPDRVLIGECRGDEVLDLLQALNTGHRGTLTTIHANSARDALKRIELLALIAARGMIPPSLIKELIAGGVQKVAFLAREKGQRKIQSVISLHGMERDVILTKDLSRVVLASSV
jgi:pilus assembly protein CpaF